MVTVEADMKRILPYAFGILFILVAALTAAAGVGQAQVTVVNMIPKERSCETNQDSEPNLAVNPANINQIAGSAFTPGIQPDCLTPNRSACPLNLAPIFVSTDGGNIWKLNCIVPGNASGMTNDITVRFGSTGNNLYAGTLRRVGALQLNILRTNNFVGPAAMTVFVNRPNVDQPYVQATTVAGNDRIYVGNNGCCPVILPGGRTATIDQSLSAGAAAPVFTSFQIEPRGTGGQDWPAIRPAIGPNNVVYGAYFGLRDGGLTDVVVVRDDTAAAGANPFSALLDPGDGQVGMRVVTRRNVIFENFSHPNFGLERLVASNLTIAVDPNNSARVCVGWGDRVGDEVQTLHVRCSTNSGATWTNDLRTITDATNPALAINDNGTIGFLYQQVAGGVTAAQRWVTHLERTNDTFGTTQNLILANVPATAPAVQFLPYIGDYVHLMAVGYNFYGIFSANNTPDKANFPNGVVYQRNANFAKSTLLSTDGTTPVAVSIDPFFFRVEEKGPAPRFQYAAKFVCGKSVGEAVAPGAYFTAVNVHNPSDNTVRFRKKVAVALPREKPGAVSRFFDASLGPDEAFEIDCADILKHAETSPRFLKGFVVVESDFALDIVAVYTAAGATGQVETLHVERVPPRDRKPAAGGKPDLVPVPDPQPGIGFCRLDARGRLVVTVKNQGNADAPASVTTVEFLPGGGVKIPTPAIPAGGSVELPPVSMPADCHKPECNFTIRVDSGGQVDESNEGNNTGSGSCIG
jgi:hypothetical protein